MNYQMIKFILLLLLMIIITTIIGMESQQETTTTTTMLMMMNMTMIEALKSTKTITTTTTIKPNILKTTTSLPSSSSSITLKNFYIWNQFDDESDYYHTASISSTSIDSDIVDRKSKKIFSFHIFFLANNLLAIIIIINVM